jgi:hypothetical protein
MLSAPPTAFVIGISIAGALLGLFAVAALLRTRRLAIVEQSLQHLMTPAAPLLAAAVTGLLAVFVWRSLHEPATIHDEQAYLLQAETFARGRWTGTPPVEPEFFEQAHVILTPVMAVKYPPGHALALVPGIWLNLPGLIPCVLAAISAGLLFAIARHTLGPGIALLAWALWTTSQATLFWSASYLSESTSGAMWLLAVWALVRFANTSRPPWLIVVGLSLGWMYLTRPLTAIALGLPTLFVGVTISSRDLAWRRLMWIVLPAVPLLLLNLLWQERSTGDWFANPFVEYTRQYLPWDKPGFGFDSTTPPRGWSPLTAFLTSNLGPLYAAHLPARLPAIVYERVVMLVLNLGMDWRVWMIPAFAVGAVVLRGPLRFGVVSFALLVGGYLIYAHAAKWTVYYAEAFPVFFAVVAAAAAEVARRMAAQDADTAQRAAIAIAMMALPFMAGDVVMARHNSDVEHAFHRQATARLATITAPAVVFVHYPTGFDYHRSLVVNDVDFRSAPIWLVYDRGADNERLLRATDRAAYRLDVTTWAVERIR